MRKPLILIASGGSALLLLAALGFQYLAKLPPCDLCISQRWPHLAAVILGLLALVIPGPVLPLLGALAALTTAGFGLYHSGVEQGWWEGPTTCTSGGVGGMSADQLFDKIMAAPLVRCDEIVWQFLGLSMASWNAILALLLAFVWVAAARARG
ncbi:disulfide bond formation protein B [Pseudodonghicola flavimaris]|uniref:Disulfide bond formation protein B n=1 Tax=Pseudodonghicola flavimaris TaxID=3050036 RepID=A0ABT7F3E4_9RHOB|nr:disulfide bond formation protein B [Pseudodonghicola flavimaris]MDK3019116.1 disulfide bond formation protein B [Pseudodonghicola flavimaris]